MSQDKVYKPEVLDNNWSTIFGQANGSVASGSATVLTPGTFEVAPLPNQVVANEVISSHLNTVRKKVLGEFKFAELGAFFIGTEGGASVRMSQAGLFGTNAAGATSFSIDAETGDAYFNGELGATSISAITITASQISASTLSAISANLGSITAGSITGVTITGGTLQTATSGNRVVLNSAGMQTYGVVTTFFESGGSDIKGMIGYSSTNGGFMYLSGAHLYIHSDHGLTFGSDTDSFIFQSSGLVFDNDKILQVGEHLLCYGASLNFGDTKRLQLGDRYLDIKNDTHVAFGGGHMFIKTDGGDYADKAAILKTSQGYRSVLCPESPEVWLFDFYNPEYESVDPLFLEVTEGASHEIKCMDGFVQVWRRRKGYAHKRFETKTEEQYRKSVDFWSNLNR